MRRQHKNHYQSTTKRKYIILSVIGVIVVVGIATMFYIIFGHNAADVEQPAYTHQSASSPFTYAGGDWGHAIEDGQSLALFGKRDARGMSPCFVTVQYEPGKADAAARLKKKESLLRAQASKLTKLDSKSMTMRTNEGEKHYTLDQFRVESSNGSNLMGGTEYGYFTTKGGLVAILGDCEKASLLPTTIDTLKNISFNASEVTRE